MKKPVTIRPIFESDFDRQYSYLNDISNRQAERFRLAVFAALDRIAENPSSAARFVNSTYGDLELRFVRPRSFPNHLIIYQITDDRVIVLRLAGAAQDSEGLFIRKQ